MNTFLPSSSSLSTCFSPFKPILYSQTFLAQLDSLAAKCNYADYMEKHVTYPPQGLLPLPGTSTEADPDCDVWSEIFDAALIVLSSLYFVFGQNSSVSLTSISTMSSSTAAASSSAPTPCELLLVSLIIVML